MTNLYCDGGVIGKNPSPIGGTWAFCVVDVELFDLHIIEQSGVIVPAQARLPEITNNLTEMLALVRGLQNLPDDWKGTVYSDSQITLGRVFDGWKWNGIPNWLHVEFQRERKRLCNWEYIRWQLLQGHPTRAELDAGIGKRGYPVSIHNQWCDRACGAEADKFMKKFEMELIA